MIRYYPVRIHPNKKVWEVDHLITRVLPIRGYDKPPVLRPDGMLAYPKEAQPIGLPTIYPPTDVRHERSRTRTKKNRTIERKSAMIPRHVYVGLASWDDWHRLQRFVDVTGPLTLIGRREGEPYALTEDDQRTLRALGARGAVGSTAVHKSLKVGEQVRIAEWYDKGLYAGQAATLVSIKRGKAEVLLAFFNGLMPVTVPVGVLEPA